MRVGILALMHESNTFIGEPTTLRHFQENVLLVHEQIRERLADTHHEIGGFFGGLAEAGIEAVPVFAARAVPYGAITAETFETLLADMFAALDQAGGLDGVLVAPHGATVSERIPDADGHWLSQLRRRVGTEIPIVGTLDPHANLSEQMVNATNALIAYRTNPHLDQRARGVEAAKLLVRTLRGEIHPTQAASFPPLAINIERQLTSEPQCRALYELADEQLKRPGVLSNSILLGFPYADVAEMGSALLAVTDNSFQRAQECAAELGQYLWNQRQEFVGQLLDMDEAVRRAGQLDGPVCLLDMGDNVGGGSPGDSTHLLHALRRAAVRRGFICLCDPQAVEQASQAGVGARLTIAVGARTDKLHGEPFEDDFEVLGVFDGRFHEPQPRHGGFTHCDQGPTVVLHHRDLVDVMLTTRRMPPFSLRQLTTFGIEPGSYQILIAKGVNAPVAAYQPVCRHLIRVNTPGCTTADMESLTFHHRRRPMFPFEKELAWHATADKSA